MASCYTYTTIQFLTGAYEALHHVAPAYVVHEASAILAFHFLGVTEVLCTSYLHWFSIYQFLKHQFVPGC